MEIKFVIIVNDLTATFFSNIVSCPLSQERDAFHFHQVKTAISTRISSFYNFTQSISNTQTIQWTMSSPNPSRNQSGTNLGTFQKGPRNLHFSTKTYFKWATVFKYLVNPLVVYTDSEAFKELMERQRTDHINNTRIYLTNRTDLWPFKLLYEVRSVYDVPGYPKSHPNTVVSEYTATQHSKYAVVADTVRKQVFQNAYYAWLDIGYFRDVVERNVQFELKIQPGFDSKRVSYNRISEFSKTVDPFTIFRNSLLWVDGGMFLGTGEVLLQFEQLYHRAVLYFLDEKLMNKEQQLLYSVYSKKGREALTPKVELQLYIPKGPGNPWFYLGYLCRKEITIWPNHERDLREK